MDISDITQSLVDIFEKFVRLGAIYAISSMEYQLIITRQDGTLLLPIAFLVGLIAGLKVTDIKDCILKR